jgi:ATP-dependent RNA helicase HelY
MPARTVVIEKLSKFTGERHEFLTPGEYTQLTGRAGRRGIDEVGHAVVLWSPFVVFEQIASLASARTYTLTSSFRPTYNMAANLVRRYPADVAHHLLNLSFAQYRADSDVVRLETQLERITERIERVQRQARCELGDVAAWRAEQKDADDSQRRDEPAHIAKLILALRVGDVIRDPGAKGDRHVMIISTSQRRGHEVRLGVLTREGRRFTLVTRDFVVAPHRVQHIDLPKPYNPGNKEFIKRAAGSLREKVSGDDSEFVPKGTPERSGVVLCPDFQAHLKALAEVERLSQEHERVQKRVKGRAESLARQFDRVLGLMEEMGYVENWKLSEYGASLANVYHEADLLVVECIRRGHLDGLDPPAVAALASTFTYESRGPGGTGPIPFFHTKGVRSGWAAIEETWQELAGHEQEFALPITKAPDPGFCGFAYAWVAGKDLAEVLEDEELSGGDFVRNVKQLIDLLRQIGDVARDPRTARAARAAADELFRGIVAASSIPEAAEGQPDVVA